MSSPSTAPPAKLADLLQRHARAGTVVWIGVRPAHRAPLLAVQSAQVTERGLAGDHARGVNRAVTLIQAEHLAVLASLTGRDQVLPQELRRNIVVAGINLLALKNARFEIGSALLEGSGSCDPCSRMEAALGQGGLNATRGHGGITARVVRAGTITVGDRVRYSAPD